MERYLHYVGTEESGYHIIGNASAFGYYYDVAGNIKVKTDLSTGTQTVYTYDELNQLIREDDNKRGITILYTYDAAGNLLKKDIYNYTTGTPSNLTESITYQYNASLWKDLLTSYNGKSITYDGLGNPKKYYNGASFTWTQGRLLTSLTHNGKNIAYQYNENGIRIGKTVGSKHTTYLVDASGTIQALEQGAYKLIFSYDSTGRREGFSFYYADTFVGHFYYLYNAQGDVTNILDEQMQVVVAYEYDSWGKLLSCEGNAAEELGVLNPFRYRGYVYDEETDFYYLNSRYYDPETGRFINADSVIGINQDMATYNLFIYCGNNPACRYDVGGMFWEEFISGVLHTTNNFAVAIGIDTAAIGAFFLMMEQDDNGVYHASFNCWQQYAGYNQFYDFIFDLGTSMVANQFSFSYDGCGYTIWAWKGDYINLGAGAELGIYRGSSGHRAVDTSLAMWMAMIVIYKNEWIIEYFPNEDQWWITGFNPKYQNVDANDLFVTIGLGFNNPDMYYAFKSQWGGDARWIFYDFLELAILQF